MRRPRIAAPGGRDRAAGVNEKWNLYIYDSIFFHKYQALCRLIFLQFLIAPDFEPILSLRLDAALYDLEAA
jgi:hypothetical protein